MERISKDGREPVNNRQELIGLSTETKPVDLGAGSSFMELDTGKVWILLDGSWYEV